MSEFDVAIRGGRIVDGTGAAAFVGDIGIKGGKIARIGSIRPGDADKVIDADGRFVTPGFVDVHTHFDAQLLWDGSATPSINHGVTSVACGNCGYTLAPVEEKDVGFLRSLMARVEGIPEASLRQLDWQWRSWGDYFEKFAGKLGINVAISVGHSAVRRKVMGEVASSEKATDEQIDAMTREVRAAVDAGAMGFSSSQSPIHFDGSDVHVPSWFADPEELIRICGGLKGSSARILEFIPRGVLTEVSQEDADLMAAMSRVAGVPLNWNTLSVSSDDLDKHEREMERYTTAAGGDAKVVGLTLPVQPIRWISFATGVTLKAQPGFDIIFSEPTIEGRIRVLKDPAMRDRIRNAGRSEELGNVGKGVDWGAYSFAKVENAQYRTLSGRNVGEAAKGQGVDPLDLIVDVVVADKLRTGLTRGRENDPATDKVSAKVWADPRAVIGASDAGAHLDLQCGGTFTTDFLSVAVRDRQLMSIEAAVHGITQVPAELYGMRGRGRLSEGMQADVNVIDLDRLDVPTVAEYDDLPANGPRVVGGAQGYDHVFVNGVEAISGDKLTGARSGTLLRSNAA